jgi:hypothetical protein
LIVYDPSRILKKVAPEKKIERAIKGNLTLKRTALTNASKFDFLDPGAIEDVALKTVKSYRERAAEDPELKDELAQDPAQLIQRVQNEVVFQVSTKIKERYTGEQYVWTPSDAETPDPEHQLNYGKIFTIGDGEQPGDRYGCRCGMEILVEDSSLDL